MDKEVLVGGNRRGDVRWLVSLSESELELLISLKKLVMRRAETIGHKALAKKFNLKMLRVLGFIIMQYVKKQVKDLSISDLSEFAVLLNASNLLNCESMDGVDCTDQADLEIDMVMDNRKRKIPGNLLNCESMDDVDCTDHADSETDMLMENRKRKIPRT